MTGLVGYVLLAPPRPSETFISNEICALREHGVPTRVFCLRDDAEGAVPAELQPITEILADENLRMEPPLGAIHWAMENHSEALRTWLAGRLPDDQADARRRGRTLWRLGCAVQIAAACEVHGITHLHCHYADAPTRVGLLVKRLTGTRCSFTGHAKDIFTMERSRLAKTVRAADFAVTCSETGARLLREAAPEAADRVHRVYHGIDPERWCVERRRREGLPLLIALGRLTPKKGFSTLIEAVAILREEGCSVAVEIIGDGREQRALLALIAERGVGDSVRFLGRLGEEQIRTRFAEATALVHPSIILESNNQDGVANAVLEAMAAGVPVIVSDVPGLGEAVTHGETGLVFPAGDAPALAARIRELTADCELQAKLSEAGRRRVEDFDSGEAAQTLLRLFGAHA